MTLSKPTGCVVRRCATRTLVRVTLSPSSRTASRPGLTCVVAVGLLAELGERVADGEGGHGLLPCLLAAELDGEGLGGDDGEVHAGAADLGAAAGGHVGVAEAEADLVERGGHVGGGHPVAVALPVDLDVEGAAVLHGDGGAVGDRRGGAGGDDVVVPDGDVLGLQHVADVVAEGADLLGLAVDRQGDGLAHRGVADAGGGDRQDDGADQDGERGPAPAQVCDCALHAAPMIGLSGPRERQRDVGGRTRPPQRSGPRRSPDRRLSGCTHRALWLSPENFPAPGQQAHDHTEARSAGPNILPRYVRFGG